MKAQASAAGKRAPTSLQTKSSSALISLAISFHLTMTKQQANGSSYNNNGGSCVAIAGADYCVITAEALGSPTCDLSASAKGLGLTRMSVMSFLVAMALAAAVVRHRLL